MQQIAKLCGIFDDMVSCSSRSATLWLAENSPILERGHGSAALQLKVGCQYLIRCSPNPFLSLN